MEKTLGNRYWDRTGFLTPRDKAWLRGEKDGSNRKHLTGQAVARAMRDIRFLVETDTDETFDPSIDHIGELCKYLADAGMTPYEAAKYLVALAFEISNQSYEYRDLVEDIELHPREDESPESDELPIKGAPHIAGQDVNEILTFRHALADGIRLGKGRVEENVEDVEIPDTVLINANTKLYKEPTKRRLEAAYSAEDWRDAIASALQADSPYEKPDPTDLDEEEMRPFTAKMRRSEIINNIEAYLRYRRDRSSHEIIRHDAHLPENLPYRRSIVIEEKTIDWDHDKYDDNPPLEISIKIESRLLTSDQSPQLVIEVSNPQDKPLKLIEGQWWYNLLRPVVPSDEETLVSLSEREISSATIVSIDSAPQVTNHEIDDSPVTYLYTLDPNEEVALTYYLYRHMEDLNQLNQASAVPDDGKYPFTNRCLFFQSASATGDWQEMPVDLILGLKR